MFMPVALDVRPGSLPDRFSDALAWLERQAVLTEDQLRRATIDTVVPEFLHPYLHEYLVRFRPMLLWGHSDTDFLWINRDGEPLDYTAFRLVFERTGSRILGKPISVHSVRYAYATAVLNADPRDTEVVSAGLAHRTSSTVNQFYDKSGTDGVNRAWMRLLRAKARI